MHETNRQAGELLSVCGQLVCVQLLACKAMFALSVEGSWKALSVYIYIYLFIDRYEA